MRLALFAVVALAGCTTVEVRPIPNDAKIAKVCIEENPKVLVGDFVTVLSDGLARHGIGSEVYKGSRPAQCEYRLWYTATRNWDLSPYLSHAELRLDRNGQIIASATYHLTGGGGFDLTKWAGTKSKMDPVIDELVTGKKPPQ